MISEPLDVAERRKMPRPPARRIFVTKPSEPNGNGCHGGMEGKSVQAVPPQVPRPPNLPRPPPPGSLGGGRGGGGDHSGARRPAQKGPPPQRHVANCEEKDRNPIDELSSAATADDQGHGHPSSSDEEGDRDSDSDDDESTSSSDDDSSSTSASTSTDEDSDEGLDSSAASPVPESRNLAQDAMSPPPMAPIAHSASAASDPSTPHSAQGLESSLSPFSFGDATGTKRFFSDGPEGENLPVEPSESDDIVPLAEEERGALLMKISEGREKASGALAGMAAGQRCGAGVDGDSKLGGWGRGGGGGGGVGGDRKERRRHRISEILGDEQKMQDIMNEHGVLRSRGMQGEPGDASDVGGEAAACANQGAEGEGEVKDEEEFEDDEGDVSTVRQRLKEMAINKVSNAMLKKHIYGMGRESASPEFCSGDGRGYDMFDPRDVSNESLVLWEGEKGHDDARDVEVDEDLALGGARIRPGEGGRLMRDLLPWRAVDAASRQECGMDAGDVKVGQGCRAVGDTYMGESGGDQEDEKTRGKSKSKWGLRVPSMFRRASHVGDVEPPPRGKDQCKNDGDGDGDGDEDDGEDEDEASRHFDEGNGGACLEQIKEETAVAAFKHAWGLDWKAESRNNSIMSGRMWKRKAEDKVYTSNMWNTRLFFLDHKKKVLLFCRDPSKKRIFWKDRSLKPRRIRTDSIVRVAMCDAPSDKGRQPAADAMFELDWRPHPDVPLKCITICGPSREEANRWIDAIRSCSLHAELKRTSALAPTSNALACLGYLDQ